MANHRTIRTRRALRALLCLVLAGSLSAPLFSTEVSPKPVPVFDVVRSSAAILSDRGSQRIEHARQHVGFDSPFVLVPTYRHALDGRRSALSVAALLPHTSQAAETPRGRSPPL